MPTEAGEGNSAEIHFLPTTSELQFNSAAPAMGAAYCVNEGQVATFIRWCVSEALALWGRLAIGITENLSTVLRPQPVGVDQ